ncbi:DUF6925 family protein [Methylobacterium oryzisoli]|uniref:DUF6925 family protein n=1 Tax=Methylobacterium oryzisoli TaxID=3385502 RepID=UPI003892BFD7
MSSRPAAPDAVQALLECALADPAVTWTFGGYGAALALRREPGEEAVPLAGRLGWATSRAALAFAPGLHPVAYETALGARDWSHAVALCVPAAACVEFAPGAVTACGPDRAALRPQDREAALFDLGLGLRQARVLLRSADPAATAVLRAACGREPLADEGLFAALLALPCDRVVLAGPHRAEAAPGGPRLHVLGKLLRLGRTHAATAPIPPGLVPVAHLHPPHPLAGGAPFDRARHDAFQALLAAWGDPALMALKARALAGEDPVPQTRAGRAALTVARAQAAWLAG